MAAPVNLPWVFKLGSRVESILVGCGDRISSARATRISATRDLPSDDTAAQGFDWNH